MSKVPQHLLDEATRRGIVPGAEVEWAYKHSGDTGIVGPLETFDINDGDLWCGNAPNDQCIYDAHANRWATVITPAPSEGLKEGMATECSPEMRAAIIAEAKRLGVHAWSHEREMVLVYTEHGVYGSNSFRSRHTPIPDHEFLRLLRLTAKQPKPIKIGSNTVEFQEDGSVKFGCTTVDFVTLEDIYERAQKQKS